MKNTKIISSVLLATLFTSLIICCTDSDHANESTESVNRSKVKAVFDEASGPYIDEQTYAKWLNTYENLSDEELAYYQKLGADQERIRLKKEGFGDNDIDSYISATLTAFEELNKYSHEKYGVSYNKLHGKAYNEASTFAAKTSKVFEKADAMISYSLGKENEESARTNGCILFVQNGWANVDHRANIGAIAISNNYDNDAGAWFCDYGVTFPGINHNITRGTTVRAHKIVSESGGMQLTPNVAPPNLKTIMLAGRFTVNAAYFGSNPADFGREVRIGRL